MKRLTIFVYLLIMVSGVRAATQYRDFTSAEGKTIRGCIRAYDAHKEIVTIERDNKLTAKVPITAFCEADQAYILNYEIIKTFNSESKFNISAQDDEENSTRNTGHFEIKAKATKYEILLENKTIYELPKLEMEYCIYYEQEIAGKGEKTCQQGILFGKADVGNMPPKSKKTLQTKKAITYRKNLDLGYYYPDGTPEEEKGRVLGLWVRVYTTLSTGEKQMREYCFPSGLNNKVSWSTKSVKVGDN